MSASNNAFSFNANTFATPEFDLTGGGGLGTYGSRGYGSTPEGVDLGSTAGTIDAVGTGLKGLAQTGLGIAEVGMANRAQDEATAQSMAEIGRAEKESYQDFLNSNRRINQEQEKLSEQIRNDEKFYQIKLLAQNIQEAIQKSKDLEQIGQQFVNYANSSTVGRDMAQNMVKGKKPVNNQTSLVSGGLQMRGQVQ